LSAPPATSAGAADANVAAKASDPAGIPGDPPCELLPWDSEHFGRRIARVRGGRLTPEALGRIDAWAGHAGIECLYFLAGADDPATAPLAEAGGFRLVDVRLTLERSAGAAAPASDGVAGSAVEGAFPGARGDTGAGAGGAAAAVASRAAAPADAAELRRLAAASHHDSRFYQDPHFDRDRAGDLYARWIEKCLADPAGIVLVASPPAPAAPAAAPPAGVQGYITAALTAAGRGQIALFAVAAEARGQGVGGRLIAAALDWFAARGAERVTVVTQGRNVQAQRIYQRFGLLSRRMDLWFHRWR
jgi:dTDP-4-amino-4,6-dideoxy-D-galactose acyltransferase